jgi:hypothetical protein
MSGLLTVISGKTFRVAGRAIRQTSFTAAGRTEQENEAFNYARTLIRYRNETRIASRQTDQFVPVDGVYVYFPATTPKPSWLY